MKLQAEIGDAKHSIELTNVDGKTFAVIDGQRLEVEISNPEPNVFLIKSESKIYEAFVSPTSDPRSPTVVSVNGDDFEVRLTDPKRLRSKSTSGDHDDGVAEIKTAMPGKVVRILVETGAAVEKGDGIIVVEAMKMQNELKSPKSGTVNNLKVSDGDTVAAGDVLATIE